MNNIEKCIKIINESSADAIVLCDEANMHYLCGFSPSEGIVAVFKNGDGFHSGSAIYTNGAGARKGSALTVIEIQKNFNETLRDIINEHKAKSVVFENKTISLARYESFKRYCPSVNFCRSMTD
ncbi:MAG: aminopeptidase P family N-terminal domain-containing protein [Eubacterium sp.]